MRTEYQRFPGFVPSSTGPWVRHEHAGKKFYDAHTKVWNV